MLSEQRAYSLFMAVVAVVMLGWAIAYGYGNYLADDCTGSLQLRLDSVKTRLDAAKSLIDQRR
jgi:hypothetical protein